ncbi:MAG: hypothetical protein MN733_10545 [Nitrososphaera sp.]|nr:hypothetical protein [Nitrososphaera sp.]
MPKYYCHEHSSSLVTPASPSSLTGSQYQLDKFVKHTAPTASYHLNSVFAGPTLQAYSTYVVNTAASGFLEVDDQGRKNLIWFAGSQNGVEYRNGAFSAPTAGVKVVWPEDDNKLHAYPIAASPLRIEVCASCGKQIPMF